MPHPLQVENPADAQLLRELLRDARHGRVVNREEPQTSRQRDERNSPKAFVLLEDLDSGGSAQALEMRKSPVPVQIVTIRGNVSGGDFALHYGSPVDPDGDEASDPIAFDASAAAAKTALEEIESIGSGGVKVHLGTLGYFDSKGNEQTATLGRWIVEFLDIADPELLLPFFVSGEISLTGDPNDVKTETHFLVPTTKQITINSAVPTGTPDAMLAGAIGLAEWYHGVGYAVDAIEARHFAITEEELSA